MRQRTRLSTFPSRKKVSELENDAGYGTYTKLSTGIPKERPCKRCAGKFGQGGYGAAKASGYQRQARQADCRCKTSRSAVITISAKDTTYGNASASAAGLMSAADKEEVGGMGLSKYLPLAGGDDGWRHRYGDKCKKGYCCWKHIVPQHQSYQQLLLVDS